MGFDMDPCPRGNSQVLHNNSFNKGAHGAPASFFCPFLLHVIFFIFLFIMSSSNVSTYVFLFFFTFVSFSLSSVIKTITISRSKGGKDGGKGKEA